MQGTSYTTRGGIRIQRETWIGPYEREHATLAHTLDNRRGVLLSSSFEFPGRYTRLDMGFVDPPLVFTARDRRFTVEALNGRGRVLIPDIAEALGGLATAELSDVGEDHIAGEVRQSDTRFPEEQRSRQPSIFSVLRALIHLFGSPEDKHLGFYGAFGYDLVFQFEPMPLRLPRPDDQRDLVLYLPDEILIVDHMRQSAALYRYEFAVGHASTKDESELTMCTDVDRNDKSRVAVPGSVRVIGRRQIELYSRLIHTVDHVEGILAEPFDALDGFLSHAWEVTVTGAPKLWAIRFIEEHERSSRRWYGGAIGRVTFDGNMNTGLTLRTMRMKDGVAEVRAGATLLYDSDPDAEEAETRLKAAALIAAARGASAARAAAVPAVAASAAGR